MRGIGAEQRERRKVDVFLELVVVFLDSKQQNAASVCERSEGFGVFGERRIGAPSIELSVGEKLRHQDLSRAVRAEHIEVVGSADHRSCPTFW